MNLRALTATKYVRTENSLAIHQSKFLKLFIRTTKHLTFSNEEYMFDIFSMNFLTDNCVCALPAVDVVILALRKIQTVQRIFLEETLNVLTLAKLMSGV